MGGESVKRWVTLRQAYPPGPPSTWQLRAGLRLALSTREVARAPKWGVRVTQGHGVWLDVPWDQWVLDPVPLGD